MDSILYNEVLAVIAGICFISYLYFGIYILSLSPGDKSTRTFFYFCVFTSLWILCYITYYLSRDVRIKDIAERLIYAGMAYVVFLLRFIIIYTDNIKNKKLLRYILIIIWLPPLIFIYKSISNNAVARDFPSGFWYVFTGMQMFIYNLISVIVLLVYYFKPGVNRRRKQGLILAIPAVIIIPIAWTFDYIIGLYGTLNLLPFWILLWVFVALYSIKKYRFISITPGLINKDISENIEEGIILLDPDLKIIFMNKAFLNMLYFNDGKSIKLQDIVYEKDILNNELAGLISGDDISFTVRINFIPGDANKPFLADMRVKKIIDDYRDIAGFLMIVSKVKNLDQLKARFNISRREMDVIHHIVIGSTNKEIAEVLGVTESTVKTHVASIYDKLRINNRVELINLLAKFNIL